VLALPDSALLRLCALPLEIGKKPLAQAQLKEF
jgi:hypothetical protein